MTSMGEVLYEQWRSNSYELARQPVFKDAAPNLRRVFMEKEATLLAAGARIPRIINSVADVAALGEGAVIRDKHGDVNERRGGKWCGHEMAPLGDHRMGKYLPATVLDEGDEK